MKLTASNWIPMPASGIADRRGRVVEHHLGHDRLDADPCRHRPWELGQRVADQPQREHEQREQEDHAGELPDGHVAGLDARRAEQHQADVRDRRDHVGQRVEPTPPLDRFDPRRPNAIGELGEANGFALLRAVRLDELHAFEALVHGGREVTELLLGPGVVLGHRTLVDHVRRDHEREHDHRDDARAECR